jgi:CxxC-x17-CxxC domain-containing protein
MPFKAPPYDHDHENEVTLFAETNFRNARRKFGIKTDDRRRHVYVIGKTGVGKTTLLENMVLSDINAGHGVAYIDPHGDTTQRLLDFIPPNRINDVVYFNPADLDFPIGFNILETVEGTQKHLVANGLMAVFKKIWPDVWSARMEYILLNSIMALLDFPGSTLLGIMRLLVDADYRKRVVSLIQDPVVKTFWVKEFAAFSEKYRTEAIAPVQNKVGQFLSAAIIRNIIAQVKSTINMREIMDTRKILLVNLSKGLVGEENARLLGAMIITRLQLSAMERVDMPEEERQDFYLYVDEFQNFATEAFANILSEARKYRLNLTVAHQYVEQLDETVRYAIFGNVGTIVSFRVGAGDAELLATEFAPRFTEEDLVNLAKYDVYLKLMINGMASEAFSATTLPPIAKRTGSTEKVVKVSRERYAKPREQIEDKVLRWTGLGTMDEGGVIDTTEEQEDREEEEKKIKELEASSPKIAAPELPAKKDKPQFEIPCTTCGAISKLSFEPDWSRPWYCKDCLEKRRLEMEAKRQVVVPSRPAAARQPVQPPAVRPIERREPPAVRPPIAAAKPVPAVSEVKSVSLAALFGKPLRSKEVAVTEEITEGDDAEGEAEDVPQEEIKPIVGSGAGLVEIGGGRARKDEGRPRTRQEVARAHPAADRREPAHQGGGSQPQRTSHQAQRGQTRRGQPPASGASKPVTAGQAPVHEPPRQPAPPPKRGPTDDSTPGGEPPAPADSTDEKKGGGDDGASGGSGADRKPLKRLKPGEVVRF